MSSFPSRTIERQRVIESLEEALSSHCLVVLTAPMGYGKTTVAQQILERSKKRTFYLSMRSGWRDNAEYLWSEACTRLEEQGAFKAGTLKLMGFPSDDAKLYHRLAFCRECLTRTPTLLVIDDYQFVDSANIDRFLVSLVNEEISGFNILLLSRAKPQLSLEYLQMKGHAAVFGDNMLTFSQEEARHLFGAAGEHDHDLADLAHEFSLGWAAALRVCLRSYQTYGAIKRFSNINDLVSEAFFSTYAPKDQCLLLKLSVLEAFSPAQAAFLSEENDAPPRLRALYEQGAFLHYSPVGDTYTIHAMLRSYLLEKLEENTLDACGEFDHQALYRRAGECCLQSGDYLQAIRNLAQAGGDETLLRILQMFEHPDEGIFMLPDPGTVITIMRGIPWNIRKLCPVGCLGFIHRYMVRVNEAEASAMLDEAKEVFLEEGLFPEETRRKIMGEIELIRAVQSFNNIEAMCDCYEKADALLQGNSSMVDKNMFWTYNCPHSAFLYLKEPGTYQSIEKLVSKKLVYFQNVSQGSNASSADLLAAERLLEIGETQKTQHMLHKAKYKALENKQFPEILAVQFTQARQWLASGYTDGIYDLFDSLRDPLTQLANPLLLHTLEVCQGYIASICNDIDHIPSWLLSPEPPSAQNKQTHAFSLIVRGKAIMTVKNWPWLEAFAEKAERQIAPLGCLFGQLHILLFKAIAASHLHQYNTALTEKWLTQALELAEPDGIATSLAEYGPHLYPLLQRMGNLHPEWRNFVRLIRLTKKYAKLDKKQMSSLTLHEMDIMELVQAGGSNKDIAAKLGITPGSAANSLGRIYAKLGAGSRVEAILKWTQDVERYAKPHADAMN